MRAAAWEGIQGKAADALSLSHRHWLFYGFTGSLRLVAESVAAI